MNDPLIQNIVTPKVTDITTHVIVYSHNSGPDIVTRDELLKYIRERRLIQCNKVVRSLWDRYQVAVKLTGSQDHEPK